MTTFTLGGDRSVLLTHMAFYGLAAILADAGVEDLTMWWESGSARLDAPALDRSTVDDAVRAHAAAHTEGHSWITHDAVIDGKVRGRMSPRLTPFIGEETWREVQRQRHETLDCMTASRSWLDLRLIGALGEPCYWSQDYQRKTQQDHGASRLEMQRRETGAEIVSNRLRLLAAIVGAREQDEVVTGIEGAVTRDERGGDAFNSMTGTGFVVPGPVDNALAWCALWGMNAFPTTPRIGRVAVTTGHFGGESTRRPKEWFYVPVWTSPWRLARVRTIQVSDQLRRAASSGVEDVQTEQQSDISAGMWLSSRGVVGLVRFPIARVGRGKGAERTALYGENVALGGVR